MVNDGTKSVARHYIFLLFEINLHSSLYVNPSTSVDGYINQLVKILNAELDKVTPLRKFTITSGRKPIKRFLSKEAAEAKQVCQKLERQ